MPKRRMLIVCTGNSCRSQMAEALAQELAGPDWEVASAGSHPAGYVHRYAIMAMAEVGVDLASRRSKGMSEFADIWFDYVITVCDHAKGSCPVFPNAGKTFHWPTDDPAAMLDDEAAGIAVARRIRGELKEKLEALFRDDACRTTEA